MALFKTSQTVQKKNLVFVCSLLCLCGCQPPTSASFPDINTAPFGVHATQSRYWHGDTNEGRARAQDSLTLEAQRLSLLAEGAALRGEALISPKETV